MYIILECVDKAYRFSDSIWSSKDIFVSIFSQYSYTMLGFLVAVLTLLLGVKDKFQYKNWRQKGYQKTFFAQYYITLINLCVLFCLSVACILGSSLVVLLLSLSLLSLFQIGLISFVILQLTFAK